MENNKPKKVSILVSTMNDGIYPVVNKTISQIKESCIFISHQVNNNKGYEDVYIRADITYKKMFNSGLSKNRNNLINGDLKSEIGLIADDDLEYLDGFEKDIVKEYENNPEADVICFRIKERPYSFKKNPYVHNRFSILKVSSVTITFKNKSILDNNILFNESFGLGSENISGEENIFLKDCLSYGLKVISVDVPIVSHPDVSSGHIFTQEQVESKAAVFKYMYGKFLSVFIIFIFAIKKRSFYKKDLSFFEYISFSFKKVLTN